MNYKTIALLALLLPFASYAQSTQARIKELEGIRFEKELELSDLGELITKKNDFFGSISIGLHSLNALSRFKSKNKARIVDEKLSDKEIQEMFKKSGLEFGRLFDKTYDDAIKNGKKVEKVFIDALFAQDAEETEELELMNFLILRLIYEKFLIKTLVVRYVGCIQALLDIDLELAQLKSKQRK